MKNVYLICNAHIDPIWQWDWEEGLTATLYTFRSVVNLCNEYDFVFAHNESLLYQWVEENDAELFEDIKRLVKAGKWKIMGGWFLQPDCNMTSSESMIRQIQTGREYFREKFGVECKTALNFDSFGHSYGLVQILKKTGYDSYMFCRPMPDQVTMEDEFIWQGPDGSKINALRVSGFYNNPMGKAVEKIEGEIKRLDKMQHIVVLWGIGNHGGGPSRKDLSEISNLIRSRPEIQFKHSVPEDYFNDTKDIERSVINKSLGPCFTGCYTSQNRIKQFHRSLENSLFLNEKLISAAVEFNSDEYPYNQLYEAQRMLLINEFHDVLPGTTIKRAEESSLRRMGSGLEILSQLQVKYFLKLCSKEKSAVSGEYPVAIFNPHPYKLETVVEAPMMLLNSAADCFVDLEVFDTNGNRLESQVVKEESNIPIEWSKKTAFSCLLEPMQMNYFIIKEKRIEKKPVIEHRENFIFDNGHRKIIIGKDSGLIEFLSVEQDIYINQKAFAPVIYTDNEDPWAMQSYQQARLGEPDIPFRLATDAESYEISGFNKKGVGAIRHIESGAIYDEVESILTAGCSYAVMNYKIYHKSDRIDLNIRVHYRNKDKMLKLLVPAAFDAEWSAQIAAGMQVIEQNGCDVVQHNWVKADNKKNALAIVNNCIYGISVENNTGEMSMLRGAAYAGHYIDKDRDIIKNDRYIDRIDQGEHRFAFSILAGASQEISENLPRAAKEFNERPIVMNVYSYGSEKTVPPVKLSGDNEIILQAMKHNKEGDTIFRLFNESLEHKNGCLETKIGKISLKFAPLELKTIKKVRNQLIEISELEI